MDNDQWYANDGNCEAPVASPGREGAEEYVSGGEWDHSQSLFFDVAIYRHALYSEDTCPECEDERPDYLDNGDPCDRGCRLDEDEHSILMHPEMPPCEAAKDGTHDWRNPQDLVGGCKENPGVRGGQGCAITTREICVLCGMAHDETSASQGVDTEHDHRTVVYEEEAIDIETLTAWWQDLDVDDPPNLDFSSPLAWGLEITPHIL